jgi:hypothetical protein
VTGQVKMTASAIKNERKRLAALKAEAGNHPSVNTAKRYKLPKAAVEITAKAGAVHGQQSRAIQVAVELIWYAGFGVQESEMQHVLDSPLTGKTYKLPERTVALVTALTPYGTLGNVMAAVAEVLSRIDKPDTTPPKPFGKGPMTKKEKRAAGKAIRELK